MASILAAQLSKIAANSTNSLNLKAQKAVHAQSLIFEPRVAASQSFDTIYTLCHEGFQELCLLDGRFLEFQRDLFSEQSQEADRTLMTQAQNEELDKRLEAFLGLVGGRLRLNPAVKTIEWLVRRFRIHHYNTEFLLTTFLPYHILPIFVTLLSIIPSKIPETYKFLAPYIRSLTQPPRHVVVFSATTNASFATLFNSYVIRISNARQHYSALLSFWAGVMTEAVAGMIDKSKSGREGVQKQNHQHLILRLLPTLNEGLAMKAVPDLRTGCYMLLTVVASKSTLDEKLLTAMMEAIVMGWTKDTFQPGLVCLSILAQQRGSKRLTRRLTKELLKVDDLPRILNELSKSYAIDKLAIGTCLTLVHRLEKTGDATMISAVERILTFDLLKDAEAAVVIKTLVLAAHRLDEGIDPVGEARSHLARSLTSLAEASSHAGLVARRVLEDTTIDMDVLEMKLKANIRPKLLLASTDEDAMETDMTTLIDKQPSFSTLLSAVSTNKIDDVSFLSPEKSRVYDQLLQAFVATVGYVDYLEQFEGLSILGRNKVFEKSLYITFYIKTWCGPYPVLVRVAAIQSVVRWIEDIKDVIDLQAILPYAIVALNDPAAKVRKAAAELMKALSKVYPTGGKKTQMKRWGSDDLYGIGKATKSVVWLSADQAIRLLRDILIPALEECILDRQHVNAVFDMTFNSSKVTSNTPAKGESPKISQSLRTAILSSLSSHIISTPLYQAKLRLLSPLNMVRGVASTSRTKVLLPTLQQWATLSPSQAMYHCEEENISLEDFENQSVSVVTAHDAEGLDYLSSIIKGEVGLDRLSLVAAVFRRLRQMWLSIKGDLGMKTAQVLLDTALWPEVEVGPSALAREESMDMLRSVPLTIDILLAFLSQLPTAEKLADKLAVMKRRRTSHSEMSKASLPDPKVLTGAIQRVTFVLQLIDSSSPSNHTSLLGGLFNSLAELQHFKNQVGSELAYLQGLVLSSLLSIMGVFKNDKSLKMDRSSVRADLLIDCIQKTTSPQVQNAALLLIASLAETAPELVLHSVMPIFTFMGSSVLRQNDEYSAHVIKQTINEVIPPLISSLRKEKGNPVTGAAELLLSFVAAYEHVPAHRRKGLFTSLVETLGSEDFLFALVAMLGDKYGATSDIKTFFVELSSTFSVDVQLQTAVKYLDLVVDVLKPKPTISSILLNTGDSSSWDPHRVALTQLSVLPNLLSQKRLAQQTGKLLERDDMDAARVRDLYSSILEKVLALTESVKTEKKLHSASGNVLEAVLGLLSTSEFVKSIEGLLDRPNEELRRKILRSLEARIDQESQSDAISRAAMLSFLPQLTAIIRESSDILYKHIAVACVDKISEKYGKKDLETVAAAAQTIASEHCLGQKDERLRIMALLCLASLVDILRDGFVPVLPIATHKALDYIEESVQEDSQVPILHNAGYAFISALIHHLPYMISGSYLDKLLRISNDSASAELDGDADDSRTQCLQLAAKQIDARVLFVTLERNWDTASDTGAQALRESLAILSTAIDSHSKSIVTKNCQILSSIFLKAFDLRRQWTIAEDEYYTTDAMNEIVGIVNEVAIKMIYKLNDSTFRPIFAKLIEWAASSLAKKDKAGRILRLQSVYTFLAVFFGVLKSIVTSYAAYFLDNVVEVLTTVNPKDENSRELWTSAVRTLVECFRHDQDDFWQSPAHFDVIFSALHTQFQHSSHLPLVTELVPAIVELAAVADSAEHHKELNSTILKHMRSETAAVRLAAVKCQQALTDKLGEEWLSMLPEMLPFISELQEDDDDVVEKETHRWIVKIEGVLGESLDSMLQ